MYRFLECTAAQYMTRRVVTVTSKMMLGDLGSLFDEHDFNSFPVLENEKVVGIVTKFDFLKAFVFTTGQMVPPYEELMRQPVAKIMTVPVIHVDPEARLTRVLEMMVNLNARSFPVMGGDGKLVGIVSREDVMRALKKATQ